ncbi:hypothetical protein J437_LFUL016826 [Ladona fulva]|uniref:Uncharacterized protein n=1 Tax=Ladona fulva TaxID=123851 RepID=A0A8K0KR91_LADFU|nr:hypothetical protein J437_LFUL016826 [Ladona fulva]
MPPLPADLPDLRDRIESVVASITRNTLIKVWEELAYQLDVCHVTNDAHIVTLSHGVSVQGPNLALGHGIENPNDVALTGREDSSSHFKSSQPVIMKNEITS